MRKAPKKKTLSKEDIVAGTVAIPFVADSFDVAMSRIYHQMDKNFEIYELGKEYCSIHKPVYSFEYGGEEWFVYLDDPSQQECIYIDDRMEGAGAFVGYPDSVDCFIDLIESKREEKNHE